MEGDEIGRKVTTCKNLERDFWNSTGLVHRVVRAGGAHVADLPSPVRMDIGVDISIFPAVCGNSVSVEN